MNLRIALLCCIVPFAAHAGNRGAYATEWPLSLSRDDGGAFRVVLTEDIYAAAQDTALADIEVFNAAGESVPSALLGPEAPLAQADAAQQVQLRWFPLPAANNPDEAASWQIHSQRDGRGRVSEVNVTIRDASTAPTNPPRAILLDLSRIREPIALLQFDWQAGVAPFTLEYTLDESDDLNRWRSLPQRYTLAELNDGTTSLRRDSMRLGRRVGPYLRLTPGQTDVALELKSIRAEFVVPNASVAPVWLSTRLQGAAVEEKKTIHYEYTLSSRVPAQQVDVVAATSNSAVEWQVRSRESEKLPWQFRSGPWMGYSISSAGNEARSEPQSLSGSVRDRQWRVDAAQELSAPPTLELRYRPEVIVFLAQGDAPFTIAAGSARSRRHDAPIAALISDLRARRDDNWQPYPAYPDSPRSLAGAAALIAAEPPPKPVDWKSYLLWGLLGGGTLLVAGLAISLLKSNDSNGPEQ